MSKKLGIFLTIFFSITALAGFAGTPLADTLVDKKDSIVNPSNNQQLKTELETEFFINNVNPQAFSFIQDYSMKYGKLMENIKASSRPSFDIIDTVLSRNGIPKELKYLAVIESYLKPQARSKAGAVGVWQFMPATARNMGLRITKRIDERKDLFKSTAAASKYLNYLYDIYEDWLLVIAAYNCGPGKVNEVIERRGSADFWDIQNYLPEQSRNHVKKFIATHYLMEGNGGITTLSKKDKEEYSVADYMLAGIDESELSTETISGRYNSAIVSKHLSMELSLFQKLNPAFDTQIADNGKYELRLPIDKMAVFMDKKTEIMKESVQMLLQSARL